MNTVKPCQSGHLDALKIVRIDGTQVYMWYTCLFSGVVYRYRGLQTSEVQTNEVWLYFITWHPPEYKQEKEEFSSSSPWPTQTPELPLTSIHSTPLLPPSSRYFTRRRAALPASPTWSRSLSLLRPNWMIELEASSWSSHLFIQLLTRKQPFFPSRLWNNCHKLTEHSTFQCEQSFQGWLNVTPLWSWEWICQIAISEWWMFIMCT